MATGPVTDRERAKVRKLHAEGKTRNDIARETGRSAGTITKIVQDLGLSFDRSATRAATAAKVADAAAKRAALAVGLLDDAARLRSQLFAPATVYSFGGKDNTYASRQVDQPPAREQREIMQATSTAINTALRIDLHNAGTENEDEKSMLDDLFTKLGAAWRGKHGTTEPEGQGDNE